MGRTARRRDPSDETWKLDAACRQPGGHLLALFFAPPFEREPDRRNRLATAAQLCARCPVRADCQAAGRNENWGMWGGHLGRYEPQPEEPERRKESA
jgi:WhiB family redox-sensing transcriptional regulator